ncbi:MAG: hypothetical protein P8M67_06565 [Opitutales bacterium]|jgi:hypothetical protein|nr:hypothetical protein [Opitutales bacterium]
MTADGKETFVAINGRVSKSTYDKMQYLAKVLDLNMSTLIANSVAEYIHQVTDKEGQPSVDMEIARFAYSKKKPKENA